MIRELSQAVRMREDMNKVNKNKISLNEGPVILRLKQKGMW